METGTDPTTETVIFVLVTATLFYYAAKIRPIVSSKITKLFPVPQDPKVTLLIQEIRQLEGELSTISPTGEFAAYFKKDRQLNKKRDELKVLMGNENPVEASAKRVKIELAVQVVFQAVGLLLLWFSGGVNAFCMDWSVFWPMNHLLRFPSVFFAGDVCGGPESGLTPVSYFVIFYLLVAAVDSFTGLFI